MNMKSNIFQLTPSIPHDKNSAGGRLFSSSSSSDLTHTDRA
jgi:hypothetical protein